MRQLWILVVVLVLFSCQSRQVKLPTISKDAKARIDSIFREAVARYEIPGVVVITANKNEILYHQAFGKLDVANDVEMTKDAIFDIASMTKPITSVAIMKLYEEGRLALDDPIAKYLPLLENREVITQFNESDTTYMTSPAKNEITIRHLLSHTSGFGYSFSNHILHLLQQKTGKESIDLPLVHEPGSKWTYGLSTRILGQLIEKITGQLLYDYFKAKIFDPLGMDDTFYVVPKEKYHRFVTSHQRQGSSLVEQPKPKAEDQSTWIFGDGGLRSTAEDYITFLQMFLNKGTFNGVRILNEKSIDLMVQNQIGELVVEEQPGADPGVSKAFPLGAGRDKFGLGFQITASTQENHNFRSPGSYSWAGIFNTHFWVDPEKEIAAVILMQVLPFNDDACIRVYQDFEQLIYSNLQEVIKD